MQNLPSPAIYDALETIMHYHPDKFTERARAEVEMLLDHCLEDIHNNSEKLLSTLIINAFRKLMDPSDNEEHIYLKKYDITQIELFQELIREFPFVKWGHDLANRLIFNKVKFSNKVVVIDIGIGQGIQAYNLLKLLDSSKNIKEVVIIGIEPFEDSIKQAEQHISSLNEQVGFSIEFFPVNMFIQDISTATLREITNRYEGDIVINASLSIHHIQTLEERVNVLNTLRGLNPMGIVLLEPNIDHFEPDFYRRFQNCYQHYYHIFKVIDQLSIDQTPKNALKLFFGREIEDVLGKNNEERYEKHEPAFRWIEKLKGCGFIVRNHFFDELPEIDFGIKLQFVPDGYLGFSYQSETVLAIIYAEPNLRF